MRKKITALATLVVIAVLVAASVALVITQRRLLTANLDESIATRADEITGLVREGRLPPTLSGLGDDDGAAQVVMGTMVIAASANVAGEAALGPPPSTDHEVRTVDELPTTKHPFDS